MNKQNQEYKGEFISKSDAVIIQSVAVMLMVWHHLFGFPDRINVPYILLFDSFFHSFFHIETILSYFGRICIVLFAFSSGYGLRKKVISKGRVNGIFNNYKMILMQILKFFCRYWMVFFVFVPLGFIIKVYSFDGLEFFKAMFGNGSFYNAEWWYIGYYVRFLLLFPIISFLFDNVKKLSTVLLHITIALYVGTVFVLQSYGYSLDFLSVFAAFLLGMYFVEAGIFERVYRLLSSKLWFFLSFILFAAVFVLKTLGVRDYVLVPVLIYSICAFFKYKPITRFILPMFSFVGKYSTYVWLTHTFFAYYFFQKLTFIPYCSELIFVWCIVLSVTVGVILEKIKNIFENNISRLNKRKHQNCS